MSDVLFLLLEITLSAGALIALVFLIRGVFRARIGPRWRYALWAVVLLRLLLPFTAESAFSLFNAVPPIMENPNPSFVQQQTVNNPAAYPPTISPGNTVAEPPRGIPGNISPSISQTTSDNVINITQEDPLENSFEISLPFILFSVWLAGVCTVLIYAGIVNLRFFRRLDQTPVALPQSRMRHPPVYLSENVSSPCLVGLFRPKIILPPSALQDQARLRYALLHEVCHLRQMDNWFALLRVVACAIHWFNPLVWLAVRASRRDCELSCDALALSYLREEEAAAYGETLIAFLRNAPRGSGLLRTATTMSADGNAMKERIRMIVRRPKTKAFTAVLLIIVTLIASVAACTSAQNSSNLPNVNVNVMPHPYTPLMSSAPGMGLSVSVESPRNIRYWTDSGYFLLLWEHGGITGVGAEIIISSEETVYWSPGENGATTSHITVEAFSPNEELITKSENMFPREDDGVSFGEPVARSEFKITRDENGTYSAYGYEFVRPTSSVTVAGKGYVEIPANAELFAKFIEKLDLDADLPIREAYELRPEGFSVKAAYQGNFSGYSANEYLAVISAKGQPHAGGFDAHIAAVFDAETLTCKSAKYFATDAFQYALHVNTRGYMSVVDVYTGTGQYGYGLTLYSISDWSRVYEAEPEEFSAMIYAIQDDGSILVSRNIKPLSGDSRWMLEVDEPSYRWVFDAETEALKRVELLPDEMISTYRDWDYGLSLTFPMSWYKRFALDVPDGERVAFSFVHDETHTPLFELQSVLTAYARAQSLPILKEHGQYCITAFVPEKFPEDEAASDSFMELREGIPEILASAVSWTNPVLLAELGDQPQTAAPASWPEPAMVNGELLPEPDENGRRTYRYEDQLVKDSLGDFVGANSIRADLLRELSDPRFTEDFYSIIIGKPKPVDDGWIVPADKTMDGESPVALYHYRQAGESASLVEKTQTQAWVFTHTRFDTWGGGASVFYGYPEIYHDEKRTDRDCLVTATFTDGTVYEEILINGRGPLFAVIESEANIMDLRVTYVSDGTIAPAGGFGGPYNWRDVEGEARAKALRRNVEMIPAAKVGNTLLSNSVDDKTLPHLYNTTHSNDVRGTTILAADLQDGENTFEVVKPMPPENAYLYGRYWYRPFGKKEDAMFELGSGDWGAPDSMEATLYSRDGAEAVSPNKEDVFHFTNLDTKGFYMLHVKADYGERGTIEWVAYFGNNESN